MKIVSTQEPWVEDGGETSELFISVVGWTARQESNRKSERNRGAHVRMVAEGRWGRGRPPLGYRRDPNGKLVIDQKEAKVVELIFDMYVTNRTGVRGIKQELERRGVLTRRDRAFWVPGVIGKILKDAIYRGRHASGVPAPVIISPGLWSRAEQRRHANHHLKPGYLHQYALQGRATCECGGTIRVEHPGRGRGKAIYFCNNRYANSYRVMKGGERCIVPRKPVDKFEQALHRELTTCLNNPEKLIVMVERSIHRIQQELMRISGDAGSSEAELSNVVEDIGRVEESCLRRRITTDRRDELMADLEARRDVLEDQIGQMSPENRTALEENRDLLTGARDYLATLSARAELGLPTWEFSFVPSVAESEALQRFRKRGSNEFSRSPKRIPESLDNVLTAFNMTAVFCSDRVELTGGIELAVPDPDSHLHASTLGGS